MQRPSGIPFVVPHISATGRYFKFRSDLEKRYALMFDDLAWNYEYELAGYHEGDRRLSRWAYKPDWRLNLWGCPLLWIESKGEYPSNEYVLEKIVPFVESDIDGVTSSSAGNQIFLVTGTPGNEVVDYFYLSPINTKLVSNFEHIWKRADSYLVVERRYAGSFQFARELPFDMRLKYISTTAVGAWASLHHRQMLKQHEMLNESGFSLPAPDYRSAVKEVLDSYKQAQQFRYELKRGV